MPFEVINFDDRINSFCGRAPGHNIAVNSVKCHSIDATFPYSQEKIMINLSQIFIDIDIDRCKL